jgi:hypothetical protein
MSREFGAIAMCWRVARGGVRDGPCVALGNVMSNSAATHALLRVRARALMDRHCGIGTFPGGWASSDLQQSWGCSQSSLPEWQSTGCSRRRCRLPESNSLQGAEFCLRPADRSRWPRREMGRQCSWCMGLAAGTTKG